MKRKKIRINWKEIETILSLCKECADWKHLVLDHYKILVEKQIKKQEADNGKSKI